MVDRYSRQQDFDVVVGKLPANQHEMNLRFAAQASHFADQRSDSVEEVGMTTGGSDDAVELIDDKNDFSLWEGPSQNQRR